MSLHHLDPRQAGTGEAPDVETREHSCGSLDGKRKWMAIPTTHELASGFYATEAEALTAARQTAGFGHVAERACDTWCPIPDATDLCTYCLWSCDAHKVSL